MILFQDGDDAGITNAAFEDCPPPPPSYYESQMVASTVNSIVKSNKRANPDNAITLTSYHEGGQTHSANHESVQTLASFPEGAQALSGGTQALPGGSQTLPPNLNSAIKLTSYPESTQVKTASNRNGLQTSPADRSSNMSDDLDTKTVDQSTSVSIQPQPIEYPLHQAMKTSVI